jgi:23S rRNA (guanosine2251-2'-O)-methyltransferase
MKNYIFILDNIRSTHNVGSIMRTAEFFGFNEIAVCGVTPYPEIINDPRLPHIKDKMTRQIHKTALGAEKKLKILNFSSTSQAVEHYRKLNYQIAALEQSRNSISINKFRAEAKCAVICGEEVKGINNSLLNGCDVIIEITRLGTKESLNVSNSAAICAYAMTTKA